MQQTTSLSPPYRQAKASCSDLDGYPDTGDACEAEITARISSRKASADAYDPPAARSLSGAGLPTGAVGAVRGRGPLADERCETRSTTWLSFGRRLVHVLIRGFSGRPS
jgi:hypothetical protein